MFISQMLATDEAMSAFLGSDFFKRIFFWLAVIVAALVFFAPTLWAAIRQRAVTFIAAQVSSLTSSLVPAPSTVTATPTANMNAVASDTNDVVKKRAAELKSACPAAPAALQLKWLEQGMTVDAARADYISVLEAKLHAGTGTVPTTTTPTQPSA